MFAIAFDLVVADTSQNHPSSIIQTTYIMKIQLQIDDVISKDFMNFLKLLPQDKVHIISVDRQSSNVKGLNKLAGSIKSLSVDPLKFQEEQRNEWN